MRAAMLWSAILVSLPLSGCQQHVVEMHQRCEEILGEPCSVTAIPDSKMDACIAAVKAK